jgi:predicted MFS family arabinose efflux permease
VFVLVFATEEMGTNTRAWALSILAVGSGVGAGSAVGAIPLAGISESSWRLVYLVGIAWLAVAYVLTRSLPETERFLALHEEQIHHTDVETHIHRDRLWLQIAVAVLTNVFVATASIFQSRYLKDVRGYSAFEISMFITITTIPATFGLVVGGRLADKIWAQGSSGCHRANRNIVVCFIICNARLCNVAHCNCWWRAAWNFVSGHGGVPH